MASPALNPETPVRSQLSSANCSELPAFFDQIAQLDREYVIFHDGWRGWTYGYSDIHRMARALASRLHSPAAPESPARRRQAA